MKISKKLKIPTYNCVVNFIITDDVTSLVNKIYKKEKLNETFSDTVEGIVLTFDIDTYHLIISSQYLSHNTLAHEIYHTAVKITEERDVTDEEAQAWVAGHITGEIYKFIQKKELTIIHGRG